MIVGNIRLRKNPLEVMGSEPFDVGIFRYVCPVIPVNEVIMQARHERHKGDYGKGGATRREAMVFYNYRNFLQEKLHVRRPLPKIKEGPTA
jgi:hypothetical protein